MAKDITQSTLQFVAGLPDILRSAQSGSLIEFTQPTRIEPIVLLDDAIINLAVTPDLLQAITSIFAGYYLQAVALSVNVGKVDVLKLLDKVNPNRDTTLSLDQALNSSLRRSMESAESYEYALPVPGQPTGLECFGVKVDVGLEDKDSIKLAQDVNNLAVGKLLQVEVESEGAKATFPISLRIQPTAVPSAALVHLLSVNQKDISIKERWHAYRAGQIEFIRDLVLCQDLIDDHKKGLLNDKTGIYKKTLERNKQNKIAAVYSGQPSVATASNIVVLSKATAKALETKISGKLSKFKDREKIFKETYSMLLVVVDTDWDMVTIYHRSIDATTEITTSDLKNPKKGNDIGDILKAYTLGNSPSF